MVSSPETKRLAYFITPHGFGHAARSAAIMASLRQVSPQTGFEIFTTVPEWFFRESLSFPFGFHKLETDVGLVQQSALIDDLTGTLNRLGKLVPFRDDYVAAAADKIKRLACDLVVADIAILGIAVGRQAGIPSVLVENFTWDWIYESYVEEAPGLREFIPYFRDVAASADYHVQPEPICVRDPKADLIASPVSRRPRTSRPVIREMLGVSSSEKLVLITMGGIPGKFEFLAELEHEPDIIFVLAGTAGSRRREKNLLFLPPSSEFYHPDLIGACDAVIGKPGYSTVAEVYHAGMPFGCVERSGFRESKVLTAFAEREMLSVPFTTCEFESGRFVRRVPELLSMGRDLSLKQNGDIEIARFVNALMS